MVTAPGDEDFSPGFSPDGSKLAFYHISGSGQPAGIYVSDPDGQNRTLLSADPSGKVNSFTWVPALNQTVSVSPTSEFESGPLSYLPGPVAGFLLSQSGTQFGGFLTFTATDNATATIRASASSPLTFTLTATWISSVTYTNVNSSATTGTLIDLYHPPSVMVSFDATTGRVDTVAPSSAAKHAEAVNRDGTVSYVGPFTAVYDEHGKNLAPAGASTLTVNPKTGKIVHIG